MLNRLYIVVGLFLILVLIGGFLAPRFYPWASKRVEIEALAAEALGTEVHITGDIEVDLLPMPRMRFGDVIVGPKDHPSAEIASVDAEFTSVLDFLRDRYAITKLVARDPHLYLTVDDKGALVAPISLPEQVKATNISIANAEIDNGVMRITDTRHGDVYEADDLNGTLRISDMRGPYAVQGTGRFEGTNYSMRVSTTALNQSGRVQISSFIKPENSAFSLTAEGNLDTGDVPHFDGEVTYRRTAKPTPTSEGGVRGDMVLTANVEADPQLIKVSAYTLLPDENRAGTRMTGDATVDLGDDRNFAVTLKGGVVSLAPTEAIDASDEGASEWAVAQLLRELPAPPMPHMRGYVHADISELELRGLAVRNLMLDASLSEVDNGDEPPQWSWALEQAEGTLPGDTDVVLAGIAGVQDDKLAFGGELHVSSDRLDTLAASWRKATDSNPLFGLHGDFSANVRLADNVLNVTDGVLDLDDAKVSLSGAAHLAGDRALTVTATLGSFDSEQSAALFALLPKLDAGSGFSKTFSGGAFDLRADDLTLFDMDGRDLVASGNWSDQGVEFNALNGVLGGASVILKGHVAGTLTQPQLSGSGRVILKTAAQNEFLPFLYDHLGVAPTLRDVADRFLPANLDVELTQPGNGGSQQLRLSGRAGDAEVWTRTELTGGIAQVLDQPIIATASVSAGGLQDLMRQLGWPQADFGSSEPGANLLMRLDGSVMNSIQMDMAMWEGEAPQDGVEPEKVKGHELLAYSGSALVSDPAKPHGRGQLQFRFDDVLPWLELAGAQGLDMPALHGAAEISVAQTGAISLSSINASAGGVNVTGQLSGVPAGDGVTAYTGTLHMDGLSIRSLGAFAAGPASLIGAEGTWPDGPFDQSSEKRESTGQINLTADQISATDRVVARDAAMDVSWDATGVRIERGTASMGGGSIRFDAQYCCSGMLAQKQLEGQFSLENVDMDALLPAKPADDLNGKVSAGLQFKTTGQSYLDMVEALGGSGSFTISKVEVAHLSQRVFEVVSHMDNILGLDASQLVSSVESALDRGTFTADELSGTVNVAGGILRAANVGAKNDKASLFGGMTLDLASLRLDGSWTLSPVGSVDDDGLITEATSRIVASVGGTLAEPTRSLDLDAMADAIQVRALELELDRLEKLRAEQDARNKEEAERRAKLMADEARRNAEAAVAAEKARQAAAAKAQAQSDAEQQQRIFGSDSNGTGAPANDNDDASKTIDLLGG